MRFPGLTALYDEPYDDGKLNFYECENHWKQINWCIGYESETLFTI